MLLATSSAGLLYSHSSGEYSITSVMPAERNDATGVTLSDGKFMIIGGRKAIELPAEDDSAIYDPKRNIWIATSQMNESRCNAGAVTLKDGRVFVAGGVYFITDKGFYYPQTVDIYDPCTDKWSKGPSHKYYYATPAMVLLENGNILLIGGKEKQYGNNSVKCELFTWNNPIKAGKKSSLSESILLSVGCSNYSADGILKAICDTKEITPIKKDGTIMIPIQFLENAFEAASKSQPNNTYTVTVKKKTINITIGKKTFKDGGKYYTFKTAPAKINKVLYLPLEDMMDLIGKKVTYFDQLIVISDKAVYMDKLDAYNYLTLINPDFKLGLNKYGKIIYNKKWYSSGDFEYRLISFRENNRGSLYIDESLPTEEALDVKNSYSYQCLIEQNKKTKEIKIISQGRTMRYLQNADNGFYFINNGCLAFMDVNTHQCSYIRSGDSINATANTSIDIDGFRWHPNSLINVANSIYKDGWVYFIWSYGYIARYDLGYPARVRPDGTELELLSVSMVADKFSSFHELADMHIIGDYIYYRNLGYNQKSYYDGFNLMRVAIDCSSQEIVTQVSNYKFMPDDKILLYRYWDEDRTKKLKFSIYDAPNNTVLKTLTLTDIHNVAIYNYTVAYTTFSSDNLIYVADITTGKTKKYKAYKLSNKQNQNFYLDVSITNLDSQYVY